MYVICTVTNLVWNRKLWKKTNLLCKLISDLYTSYFHCFIERVYLCMTLKLWFHKKIITDDILDCVQGIFWISTTVNLCPKCLLWVVLSLYVAATRAIMCRDKFQSVSYMKSSISSKLLTTLRKNIAIVCQFLEKNMSTLYIKHSLTPNMSNSIKLPNSDCCRVHNTL